MPGNKTRNFEFQFYGDVKFYGFQGGFHVFYYCERTLAYFNKYKGVRVRRGSVDQTSHFSGLDLLNYWNGDKNETFGTGSRWGKCPILH